MSLCLEDAVVMVFRKGRLGRTMFHIKYVKDLKHITRFTTEHLRHFSHQIVIVEEICMATLVDGYLRTPTKWVREARNLQSQVMDALEENKDDKDPTIMFEKLEHLCVRIFALMKECPVEDGNDKPLTFLAWMHEIDFRHESDGSVLLSEDVGFFKLKSKQEYMSTQYEGESSVSVMKRTNSYAENKYQSGSVVWTQQGMIIPILVTGKMSEYVDLRLEISSISSSRVTSNLNSVFGLNQDEDKYLFSDKERDETSYSNGTPLLPECLLVNRSGSQSKEMPTADEWKQACVVNLINKILLMPSEEPECPNLVLLFLQRNGRLTKIPTSFFYKMPALRFIDLSDTRIKALPSSLFMLPELQVLLLRSCACLDSLPADIQKLENMEVLDFLGTDVDLPKQIGKLTKLKYLQLSFNRPDDLQPELVRSGALSALQDLQALSIEVHPKDHHYWIKTVGTVIQQVSKLQKLSYLQFYFPTVEDLNSFIGISLWKEERLRRFNFVVGHNMKRIISRVPDEVESMYEQHERCLRYINGSEVAEDVKSILRAVTAFYLDHHSKIKSLSEFNTSTFKELKFCIIRECCDIQVMINGTNSESVFPNLNYLGLHYLWNLERIWEGTIPSGSFQALEYMRVSTCGKLEYIASHSILQCLSNLETLIIEDCESLKSLVKENKMVKCKTTLLPRLKELVLRHLPQLVALGSGLFPPKEITHIEFCPNLVLEPYHRRIGLKRLLSSSSHCWLLQHLHLG